MPPDSKSTNYRATMGDLTATPLLAIRSTSAVEQMVKIGCISSGRPFSSTTMPIAPNQTLFTQACSAGGPRPIKSLDDALATESQKQSFGISISSSAHANEIAVFGVGVHGHGSKKSLSSMPFWDVSSLRSSIAIYPGVPIAPNPAFGTVSSKLRASVANFGGTTRKVTISLCTGDQGESSKKVIAELTVPPYSTSTSDLRQLPAETSPSNSVIVQMEGDSGELLSDIQDITDAHDQSLSITLPWKDANQIDNAGEHPWTANDSVLSTVLLFNPDPNLTNRSVRFQIHTGRAVWTKQLHIPPLTTTAVSINEIIEKQLPDDKGNRLPVNSSTGIITWSSLANPRIFGKLVRLDEITQSSRTYACSQFNPICGAMMSNAYEYTAVGQQVEEEVLVQDCDNGGNPGSCDCYDSCGGEGGSGASYSWSSGTPNIASLVSDPTSTSGLFQGNSVGEAFVNVNLTDVNGCGTSAGGQIYVQPTVQVQVQNGFVSMAGNGLVVLAGPAGGLNNTAITASGNPGGGSVNWTAGPNLTINGVNSANASVSGTGPSTSGGDTYVSVTYTVNGQSASASTRFTVQNPTQLSTTMTGGSGSTQPYQNGNNAGYITTVTYYLYDQMSPANIISLPGMPLTEVLTTTSNPFGAQFVPPDNTPNTANSNSAGQMPDYLWAYAPGGLAQGFSASRNQILTANGFAFNPTQQQSYTQTYGTVSTATLSR